MDETELMINDCLNRVQKMNKLEEEFIYSIQDYYEELGSLTASQEEKLNNIWERVT